MRGSAKIDNLHGWPTAPLLRLKLDIPVEIIHPAFMQMVGREQAAVVVQVVHRRLVGLLQRPHLGLRRHHAAFPEVTGRAGGDDILPGRRPAAVARDDMVEGEIVRRAAILALPSLQQRFAARWHCQTAYMAR